MQNGGVAHWPAQDQASLGSIQIPIQTLATPAQPCNPINRRRLAASEYTSGRLIVSPIAIIPTIEPTPKTTIDNSPDPNSWVDESTINISAADPASPCAIPMQSGRMEPAIQCRWR